jgi:hypothetical protein
MKALQSMKAITVYETLHMRRVDDLNEKLDYLEHLKRMPPPEDKR